MLGRQQTLLKSPLSNLTQPSFNASGTALANTSVTNASNLNQTLNAPATPIDEKSIKDIIQILNKCIDKTKNLTEFSQIIQVDNIG